MFILEEPFLSLWKKISIELGEDNIFLVGGFVRDTLLGRQSFDMDLCCRLSPQEIYSHYPDSLFFPRFGTVSFKENGIHVTIASLRKEEGYQDYRHPNNISFVTTIEEDYLRRDFTINCLYVDCHWNIIDPTNRGLDDLHHGILHLIGDAIERLTEDPLRILRAYRFREELNFSFDEELKEAIQSCKSLLSNLNPNKINEELKKVDSEKEKIIRKELGLNV